MLTLYGYPTFNPLKTVITAEELGLDYDYVHINLAKRQNLTPEHLERHPYGKVPVLIDGDLTLSESNTICRYLSRIADYKLYSQTPSVAGKIDEIIDLVTLQAGKSFSECFWEEVIVPRLGSEPNQDKIQLAKENLKKQLPYLDQVLAKQTFLAGSEFSIADIIAYTYVGLIEITSVNINEYKNLLRWYRDIDSREAVQKAKQQLAKKN
ncbi:glutathione S-transferase family protein [Aurantivibrio plasticivorans]